MIQSVSLFQKMPATVKIVLIPNTVQGEMSFDTNLNVQLRFNKKAPGSVRIFRLTYYIDL